jgi:hypothetical protein
MKNLEDPIGKRTREVPARCAILQPTVQPRTPLERHSSSDTYRYIFS